MFKINIENSLRQAGRLIKSESHGDYYRHTMKELIKDLKAVRGEHEKGFSKEVLTAFFNVYVFDD